MRSIVHYKSLVCLKALDDFILPTDYAVVIRTGAEQLDSYEELKTELTTLISTMDDILLKAKTRTCFSLIYQGVPSYIEYLHHIADSEYEEVVTDNEAVYEALQTSYKGNMPIRFYNDDFPLSKLYSIETKMEEVDLQVQGRHDPCIVPRAVPVVEAAAAIALMDAYLSSNT